MTALQRLEVGATEGGNEILGVENLVPRHKVKELLAVRRFSQTVLRTIVLTPEQRAEAGISGGLIRTSVGLEDVEDLKRDLSTGLQA